MTHHPIRHPNGQRDERYSVALEFCGYAQPRYVLRFCGEFVDSFRSIPAATLRAIGHRNAAAGNVIVEVRA